MSETLKPDMSLGHDAMLRVEIIKVAKPWNVPNFVTLEGQSDGVSVKDVSRDTIDRLALAWITDLYAKAGHRPPDLKWNGPRDRT